MNGKPTVTDKTVAKPFNDFFKACYDRLKGNVPLEWPTTWNDAPLGPWNLPNTDQPNPNTWTGQQALLLQAYDKGKIPSQQLWPQNLQQIQQNLWPQFYIGAFPYCYQIPEKDPAEPTESGKLKMGQSPGTHWYHAHKHGSTAINVANGMTGVFVIEGRDLRRQAERVVRPGLDAAPAHPGDQSTWRHAEPAAYRARPDRQRP